MENLINKLEQQGWDRPAIRCFLQWNRTWNTDLSKQTQLVGSEIYTAMFLASRLAPREKALLVIKQMGGFIDSFGMLQLKGPLLFDADMPPDSTFLKAYADCVYASCRLGFVFRKLDDKSIHQFRYYIDLHNISYIRKKFKRQGMTDEEALAAYAHARQSGYLMIAERSRLHNKYPDNESYAQSLAKRGLNRKKLTPDFHSEFILDEAGSFVSQWNVLERKNGFIISDPMYYKEKYSRKDIPLSYTWEEARWQVANTESFNYGRTNNSRHIRLDAEPVKNLDPPYRSQMIAGYGKEEYSLINPTVRMYQKKREKKDNWSR